VPLPKGSVSKPDYREELASFFKGWAIPVQTLIQRLDPFKTNRVEIHDIEPLQTLVRGRVALLGDAAHSTAPDLGQGGCQAMEDALVLSTYLQTTNISVEDALKRYEAARKDRVADVVTRARKRSNMTHGKEPEKPNSGTRNSNTKTARTFSQCHLEDNSGRTLALKDKGWENLRHMCLIRLTGVLLPV
jgi:FAD-dependent urate hydroxylase